MGNVDACQNVQVDCRRIDECQEMLSSRKKRRDHATGGAKSSTRSCPSKPASEAPLAFVRAPGSLDRERLGREPLGLWPVVRLPSARSTVASTPRSLESAVASSGPALMLPIPSKAPIVRQGTRGTPLSRAVPGATGATPKNGVVRSIVRRGTRGTPLTRHGSAGLTPHGCHDVRLACERTLKRHGSAGMTPLTRDRPPAANLEEVDESMVDYHSSTPSDGVTRAKVVKAFVKTMVQGSKMKVVVPGGSIRNCWVSLDEELSALSVAKDGHKRHIPLEQIDDISVGQDAEGQDVEDHCVTLLLEDGQGITFHFEDMDERDTFAECLSMVVIR